MTAMPHLAPHSAPHSALTPALAQDEPELPNLTSRYEPDILFIESAEDWRLALHSLEGSWKRVEQHQRYLRLDCEADGKDARTAQPLLLQVAASEAAVYIMPLNKNRPNLGQLWELVRYYNPQVIGHNLAYDYKLLRAHGFLPANAFTRIYDTQLAELVLTTGHFDQKAAWLKSVSLKSVTAKYLALAMDKKIRESFIGIESPDEWEPTDEQLYYGALDVMPLVDIEMAQLKQLKLERLVSALALRLKALQPVVEMELRGMLIDQEAWRAFLVDVEREREEVEAELVRVLSPHEWQYREQKFLTDTKALNLWLDELDILSTQTQKAWEGSDRSENWGTYKKRVIGAWREAHPRPVKPALDMSPINLDSPKQKLRAFQALGLEMAGTGKLERARALRGKTQEEQRTVLERYQRFSELNQILKGFGENILAMIDPATGKLHTRFNIHVTETGRWSSEKPNFQNMPRVEAIRHAFIAPEGYVVITADYSGQELAIVACLSDCWQMKQDIKLGKDLYKEVASRVWHIAIEAVTSEQRQKAKSALLGINYGLSAGGLERNHGIAPEEGKALLEVVKSKYPQVVEWGDKMALQAFNERYVQTPIGTKRYFIDPQMPRWQYDTQGRNMPVQGTAADIAYRLVELLETQLVPQGILPVNFVHDEIVALAPEAEAEKGKALLVAAMQDAFESILPEAHYGLRIGVDAHVARYWTKN